MKNISQLRRAKKQPATPTVTATIPRSGIGGGLIIVFGHIATAIIGVATLRLLTELAPKDVFGNASLIMTLLGLAQHIAVAPFSATVLRFHTAARSKEEACKFSSQALAWSLATSSLVALLVGIGLGLWQGLGMALASVVIGTCVVWQMATALKSLLLSQLQAEQRRLKYSILQIVEALMLGGFTALALFIAPTIEFFIIGQAIAAAAIAFLIVSVVPWPVMRELSWPERRNDFLGKVKSYGTAFIPLSVLGFAANLADRYVLANFLGATAVGQYVAAFAIANRGMALANSSLSDYFRPKLFAAENANDSAAAQRVFLLWLVTCAATGAVGVSTVYLIGEPMVILLLAAPYRNGSVSIMIWVTLAYSINGLTQVLENRLLSLNAPRTLTFSLAVGAVSNFVASILFISSFGVLGAAMATCASFAVQAMVTAGILFFRRRRRAIVPGAYR